MSYGKWRGSGRGSRSSSSGSLSGSRSLSGDGISMLDVRYYQALVIGWWCLFDRNETLALNERRRLARWDRYRAGDRRL